MGGGVGGHRACRGDGDPVAPPVGATDDHQAEHETEDHPSVATDGAADHDEQAAQEGKQGEGLGRVDHRSVRGS